jgi:hypothetical protein
MATTPGRGLTEKVDEWGVSGELNWDFGGATLTSITAYRDWKARCATRTSISRASIAPIATITAPG